MQTKKHTQPPSFLEGLLLKVCKTGQKDFLDGTALLPSVWAKLKPADRAKTPVAFQESPAFTNHLRLSHNNNLSTKAGIKEVPHRDAEVLQPDNGERFFYECYLQQLQREADGIGHDERTNRCLCRDCGKVNNPHHKRKKRWNKQQDLPTPTALPMHPATTPAPPAAPVPLAPKLLPALMQPPTAAPGYAPIAPYLSSMPQPLSYQQMPIQSNVGVYSQLLAATTKKKRRNTKKKQE